MIITIVVLCCSIMIIITMIITVVINMFITMIIAIIDHHYDYHRFWSLRFCVNAPSSSFRTPSHRGAFAAAVVAAAFVVAAAVVGSDGVAAAAAVGSDGVAAGVGGDDDVATVTPIRNLN